MYSIIYEIKSTKKVMKELLNLVFYRKSKIVGDLREKLQNLLFRVELREMHKNVK